MEGDIKTLELTDEQLMAVSGGDGLVPPINVNPVTQVNNNTSVNSNAAVSTNAILFSKLNNVPVGTINTNQANYVNQQNGIF